ncbi:MAG: ATP-binding protein [Acidobacteriota bacterium]
MTLRSKLLLSQLPLVAALLVLGIAGIMVARSLGQSSRAILQDNYRSVLAVQRMKESLERMDSGALFLVADHREEGEAQAAFHRARFEEELRVQEANITEEGERAATRKLREAWNDYGRRFDRLAALEGREDRDAAYFSDLLPAFDAVKSAAAVVLDMNQAAMEHKSDRAQRAARRFDGALVAVGVAATVAALLASLALTTRVLTPLRALGRVAHSIGEGDLAVRARLPGGDEIAAVAGELDTMAERLQQYRQSSLGELIEARNALQASIDSMPDPVLVLSVEGHLLHLNRAAEDLLGLSLARGDALAKLAPAVRETVERVCRHVVSGGGPFVPKGLDDAIRVDAPDGERRLLPRATPVLALEGRIVGTTIVLQEVTRLVRFDQQKDDLVATVAHELRTPLTSLRLAVQLCLEGAAGQLSVKQAELLGAAREDLDRLQSTVDDLLDMSRIQGGRLGLRRERLALEPVVHAALEAQRSAASQKAVALRQEIAPGASDVFADPDRLAIVLGNLVGNAVRHSPSGSDVVVRARAASGWAHLEVEDHGPGIPEGDRERVFEKFVGSGTGSTGLGLFIAKEIVEAHGGAIGLSSEEGRGATFWVRLPLA